MGSFRRKAYYNFVNDLLSFGPRLSQIQNFAKYKYYSVFGSHREKVTYTPLSTVIFVTKRCNLNCSFCYIRNELNLRTVQEYELDVDGLKKILDHPLVENSLRIGFTGGEPFLNRNIFEMIKIAKERKHLLTVVTNGMLLRRMSDHILESGINLLSVSLYEENVDKLYDSIPTLAGKMFIKLHKTIFSDKLEEIYETIQIATDLKVDGVLFINYYPRKEDIHRCVFDDNGTYAEIKKEIDSRHKNKVAIEWFAPLLRNLSPYPRKCRMLFNSLQIDAKGNISPCCFVVPKEDFGNIFEDDDPWNSKFHISMRRMMNDTKIPIAPMCQNCYLLIDDLYKI